METEEMCETLVFSSTLTPLIAQEDFSKLDINLEICGSRGGDYGITGGGACSRHLCNDLTDHGMSHS
jgi:hypothetical protein